MPTRTIFFHISTIGQVIFYLLAALALGVCFYGFYRRWKLWRQGRPIAPVKDWPDRIKTVLDQAIAHRRVRRRKYAGSMHMLIFFGMGVLFIGTCIVAVEHYGALLFGDHWFYKGAFYLGTKTTLDLFGLALLVGTLMALGRRYAVRPRNLGHEAKDGGFLFLLMTATLTGFLLEGAGLAADPSRHPYASFSPIGSLFSFPLQNIGTAGYAVMWWIHMPLVLGVIAALPYGRWLHLFVIPPVIVLRPERPMGALEPVSMESVEETGRIGLATLPDMDQWQLMSLDGCMECGRCTDACPANAVGKELNPKGIVLDLRKLLAAKAGDQSTDVISDESLWACTNCHACVRECPALIRHVDIIDGIRRYRVAEGRFSGTGATMLRQLGSRENPWGLPNAQRLDWAKDLNINPASAEDGREVLFWVGCAGAFEPRAQKTVRAIAQLLQEAGVKFTVLGPKERCTGDPARRTGDEFLFQQLAETNITTLNGISAKTIITQCPHCFNTMKNEYPQFGGNYEVLHHTQYLQKLVEEGRLKLPQGFADSVTYHDPCFLARVNNETEAPRALLKGALQIPLTEVGRRESKTFCCGAGGGRMWMEEDRSQRPGVNRAEELLATGAKTVAVGCPFCKVMVGDSIAQVAGENAPPVLDVAEVMLLAVQSAKPAPAIQNTTE
jgi:Fe-S oxidoreductase/nitrate reductase gamma subunit